MRNITTITIHCSATPNGKSLYQKGPVDGTFITTAQVIDGWHKERGFKRALAFRQKQNYALESIGYHFVICTNGVALTGRHLDEVGAHAQGHNTNSIGICLEGTDKFTPAAWATLKKNVEIQTRNYPSIKIINGHRDLSPDKDGDGIIEPFEWLKTCPGFDVAAWLKNGMNPLPQHILQPGEIKHV